MMIHKRKPQKTDPLRGLQNHGRPATNQIPFKNVCIYTYKIYYKKALSHSF